jgi:thioredoxin-dependent peroxiredoxin
MLKIGDIAPDFELLNQHGQTVKLSELCQQKMVVLFFYPKNETHICTAEACAFRDRHQDFSEAGAELIGISRDSIKSHQSFAKNHGLNYQLLSDHKNKVRKLFGVPNAFIFIPGRVTFVINKQMQIVHVFDSMRKFEQHVAEALKAIKEQR